MPQVARPGAPLQKFLTSRWFNNSIKKKNIPSSLPKELRPDPTRTWVIATAGLTFQQFEPANLVEPFLDYDNWGTDQSPQYQTTASKINKTFTTDCSWGVAQDIITENNPGFIVTCGLTWARLTITDNTHQYAKLNTTTGLIESTDSGEARIVSPPEGTAEPRTGIGFILLGREPVSTSSTPINLVTFYLTQDLLDTFGGTATAMGLIGLPITGTTPIVVVNTGKYQAYTGATGLAVEMPDGKYWILQINQPAQQVYAVLDTHPNTSGGSPRFGADPREVNCALKVSPAPYSLTPYPFSWLPIPFPIAIANPDHLFGNVFDGCMLTWNRATSSYRITAVYPLRQQQMWVKLAANRPNGLFQAVSLTGETPASHGAFPAPLVAVDHFNVLINAKANHKTFVAFDASLGYYIPLEGQHTARRVRGALNGSFSETPATFGVNVVSGMDGVAPTGPITVKNRYNWPSGVNGNPIEVLWDTVAGEWYPEQMRWDCPIT